jgi:hemoglobin
MSTHDWVLVDECGGPDALMALLQDFYDRLYQDLFVGFFFTPHDKATLVAHQYAYITAHLGARSPVTPAYTGRPMIKAHAHMPILVGHFNRRHVVLREVLMAHKVPEHVRLAWLELDESLRGLILARGAKAAHELNHS